MDCKEVSQIYYYFTSKETGRTLYIIILVYDNSLWGKVSPNSKFHGKIPSNLCLNIIRYMDMKHMKGKKVAFLKILNWI